MSQAAAAEWIPLEADSKGVLRIAGTRVTLDTVVKVYRAGNTPEEIARFYPSLQLADIYAVLTYYLRHQEEVEAYLRRRHPPAGIGPKSVPLDKPSLVDAAAGERSELLARKYGGQNLSPAEKDRLEALTDRLREYLPPISLADLEALLGMTDEVKRIRERASERRRRLRV